MVLASVVEYVVLEQYELSVSHDIIEMLISTYAELHRSCMLSYFELLKLG